MNVIATANSIAASASHFDFAVSPVLPVWDVIATCPFAPTLDAVRTLRSGGGHVKGRYANGVTLRSCVKPV